MLDLTILLIEDDASIRNILATFLELLGYRVIQAENGVEGLDFVKSMRIDLVITDIFMPVMDGNEFILNLAALPTPPPVIVLSGDTRVVNPNPIISEIVTKPLGIQTLKAVVARLLLD